MPLLSYLPKVYLQKKLQTRLWSGSEADKTWIETALNRGISLFVRADALRVGAPTQTHHSVYVGNWAMGRWPELKLPCLKNMTQGQRFSQFGPSRGLMNHWLGEALKENSLEIFQLLLKTLPSLEWQGVVSSMTHDILRSAPYSDMSSWMKVLLTSPIAVDHVFPYVIKAVFETLPKRLQNHPFSSVEEAEVFIQDLKTWKNIPGWRGEAFAHALISHRIDMDDSLSSFPPLSQYVLKSFLQQQVELAMNDGGWVLPISLLSEKELRASSLRSQWHIPSTFLKNELPNHPFYGPLFEIHESTLLKKALMETLQSTQVSLKPHRL